MSKRIRFGRTRLCFVRDGRKRCRGLTRLLERRFPVLLLMGAESERSGLRGIVKRADGSVVKQCAVLKDREHGIRVDDELYYYARYGEGAWQRKRAATADCCTVGLLRYLRQRGWQPIASQQAIYSKKMRLATAIDLLCTDVETRSKLYLIEVKSTLDDPIAASCRAAYEQATGTMSPLMGSLPLCYYTRHQVQLWTMVHILRHEYGVEPDQALVLRVGRCGSSMLEYPLNPWFEQRAQTMVRLMKRF